MDPRRVPKVVASCVVMAILTVLPAGPAEGAPHSISMTAAFASPTVPGRLAPAEFEIANTSDLPYDPAHRLTITDVRLIPGCGTPSAGCPVPDPGIFRINGPIRTLAMTGGECRDTWTATMTNPSTGEVRLTPDGGPLSLRPTDRCRIRFTTTTLRVPSVDASAMTGLQTAVQSSVLGHDAAGTPVTGGGVQVVTVDPAPEGRLTAVAPARIHDTRGTSPFPAPGFGGDIQVTGKAGVPADATAVVLNVTAVSHAGSPASYMTLWPSGQPRPAVSNLNYVAGQIVPNQVTIAVGDGGKVTWYNHEGRVDVIVDVFGYYSVSGPSPFNPVRPDRILDTRSGNGAPAGLVGADGVVDLQVTGRAGVPTDATAVVMNVTAGMVAGSSTFVTAWPAGEPMPLVSNLNPAPGEVRSNLVVVKIGNGGMVSLRNDAGQVHLLADVAGYFGPAGDTLSTVYPERLLDTRFGVGTPGALPAGTTVELQVAGQAGVPAGATAVVLNITAVNLTGASASWLTAWPTGEPAPVASNVNMVPGQVTPNLAVVKIGAGGRVSLRNAAGTVHVLADLTGSFT